MAIKQMKTLTIGESTYKIVDEEARANIEELEINFQNSIENLQDDLQNDIKVLQDDIEDLKSNPVIITDNTLTQSGQAADAKVVGEALSDKVSYSELPKVTLWQGKTLDGRNKVTIDVETSTDDGYTINQSASVEDGKDGTSVTVTSVSESTADGGSNVVTFSDGKTVTIKNGNKGDTGSLPVRGIDYWTAADQEAIVQHVITALGTPVFGSVKDNNQITLSIENLAEGTYEIGFEDENKKWVLIGYINHSAELPNVFNPDTASINTRLSSSSGATKACDGVVTTDFIPLTLSESGRKLTMTGGTWWDNVTQNSLSKWVNISYYDSSKNALLTPQFAETTFANTGSNLFQFFTADNDVYSTDIGIIGTTFATRDLASFASQVQFVRISIGVSQNAAITKNDIANIKLTIE